MDAKDRNPTILFAGGGTGGHLYPGISVAIALKKVWPEAKPLFLVTQREIDRVILQPTGFEFIAQPIVPPVKSLGGMLSFWKSWRQTNALVRRVLAERSVRGALGLGGYAAGVGVKLAAQRNIPTAIINPDVIPGKANQFLLKYVSAACCQFEETRSHVSQAYQGKLKFTGCPIRPEIAAGTSRAEAASRLGLDPQKQTLVITGASQGAQTVNEAVLAVLPSLDLAGWQVLHLAGREHAKSVSAGYERLLGAANLGGLQGCARVIDFTPEMADVWAVADIAISRSGASSCAELTACGIPSILIPYPFHKDMHQRANAQVLERAGAAMILDDVREASRNAGRLRPMLALLLGDAGKRKTMAAAARALGKPGAAEEVARVMAAF